MTLTRRIGLAAAVAALVLTPAASHRAAATVAYGGCAAGTSCGVLYYADAAHTILQGAHTTNCDGVVLDWGVKSGYPVSVVSSCDGGGNPV